jgi:hypothetical protein
MSGTKPDERPPFDLTAQESIEVTVRAYRMHSKAEGRGIMIVSFSDTTSKVADEATGKQVGEVCGAIGAVLLSDWTREGDDRRWAIRHEDLWHAFQAVLEDRGEQ